MVKDFTVTDMARLQAAEAEKVEMKLFINKRFRQFAALTNIEDRDYVRARSEEYPFRVANLLAPKMVKNAQGKDIEVFVLEDSVGGDQWGTDYHLYYVPTEYVFEREVWTRKFLDAVDNGWAYVAIPKGYRNSSMH